MEVSGGDIDAAKLTIAQQNATSGLYAAAMAGFLQWLSPRLDKIQQVRPKAIANIRSELNLAGHARTSAIVGDLLYGFKCFMKFAYEKEVISSLKRKDYEDRAKEVITTVAGRQQDDQQTAEPANHFLSLITAVLASRAGHLAAMDGSQPDNAKAWGWTEREVERGVSTTTVIEARSPLIGWIEKSNTIYLEPEAAFSAAQRIANAGNSSLAIQGSTLWKRLYEGGHLARIDESGRNKRYKVRVTASGRRQNLIALRPNALEPDDEGEDKINSQDDSSEHDCAFSSPCNPETDISRSDGKDDPIFGDFNSYEDGEQVNPSRFPDGALT